MARLSLKQVGELAVEIIRRNPDGIRWSVVVRKIGDVHPDTPPGTVAAGVNKLAHELPPRMVRRGRGMLFLPDSTPPTDADDQGREADEPDDPTQLSLGVQREHMLYEPFAAWLRASQELEDFDFAHAKVTATARGRQRSTGQWSRPDVTAVQVWRSEWLPTVMVEVLSYEIKRAVDADSLTNIYEAAAHGRWAHRSSLVIEADGQRDTLPGRVIDEIKRFQLGLYRIKLRDTGELEVEPLIEPGRQNPESEELAALLSYFFEGETQRRRSYKNAIGR